MRNRALWVVLSFLLWGCSSGSSDVDSQAIEEIRLLCAATCASLGRCPGRDQGLCFEPCKKIYLDLLKDAKQANPQDPLGQALKMKGFLAIHKCMGTDPCEKMIKCLRKAHKKEQL